MIWIFSSEFNNKVGIHVFIRYSGKQCGVPHGRNDEKYQNLFLVNFNLINLIQKLMHPITAILKQQFLLLYFTVNSTGYILSIHQSQISLKLM